MVEQPQPQSNLSSDELTRVSRQLIIEGIGMAGQKRLKAGRVAIIGMGGLGTPAALYLAAAGVGHLSIFDDDIVDITNLHRQPLFRTEHIGTPKVLAAAATLKSLYPHTEVAPHNLNWQIDHSDILSGFDIVLDCTDNSISRYAINRACIQNKLPLVYGAISKLGGQISVFNYGDSPCLACVFPEPSGIANCAEAGVLGVTAGQVGVLMATEAIKILLPLGKTLAGRLLTVDLLNSEFQTLSCRKNPYCLTCASPENKATTSSAHITASELLNKLKASNRGINNLLVIDIRSDTPNHLDIIPGSIPIPAQNLFEGRHTLDKEQTIVLYCQFGIQSDEAAQYLSSQNFQHVYSLRGGLESWLKLSEIR